MPEYDCRGHWKGTPVAIKKWFDPNMSDELMQEFRSAVENIRLALRVCRMDLTA